MNENAEMTGTLAAPGETEVAASMIVRPAHGFVLTHATLDYMEQTVDRGRYTLIKVVTGWGVDGGWTPEAIDRVLRKVPTVIVRTRTGEGDPAHPEYQWLNPDAVVQELKPWYQRAEAMGKRIIAELGNEPNRWLKLDPLPDGQDPRWVYRYYLEQSVLRLRRDMPNLRLCSTGIAAASFTFPKEWYEVLADVIRQCDYVGFHGYGHCSFVDTDDWRIVVPVLSRLFSGRRWLLTEFGLFNGIQDACIAGHPNPTVEETAIARGRRYARFIHYRDDSSGQPLPPGPLLPAELAGAAFFHLNQFRSGEEGRKGVMDPWGDSSYAAATLTNPIDTRIYFVSQQYFDILGRQPDSAGFVNWTNHYRNNEADPGRLAAARVAIVRGFMESGEFRNTVPALRDNPPGSAAYNQEYVRQCYLRLLRRPPDAGGFDFWVRHLNSTRDYNSVVNGFIASGEYRSRFASI